MDDIYTQIRKCKQAIEILTNQELYEDVIAPFEYELGFEDIQEAYALELKELEQKLEGLIDHLSRYLLTKHMGY